ncbi:DDE-type integrase/transposase/recombinase [Nocardioides sp.]|uniref:DDE-type integrase/transposase/recombinase n=1 Tax=Nocardioides sp. TaxID=35761 RepID=UPI003784F612
MSRCSYGAPRCTPNCGSGWESGWDANGSPGCCGSPAGAGSATATSGATSRRGRSTRTSCNGSSSPRAGPVVVHRHHRAPDPGRKVYCAAVLDVFTRQVVGWSIADHMRSELVVDALQMAIWRRRPGPGPWYTPTEAPSTHPGSSAPAPRRQPARSMGRVASSVDNSMIESFWSTMQREPPRSADLGDPRGASAPRSSSGSRPGTTPAPTPRSGCSAPSNTNTTGSSNKLPLTFTPPPTERHDHHTTRVRRTGSGSLHAALVSDTSATETDRKDNRDRVGVGLSAETLDDSTRVQSEGQPFMGPPVSLVPRWGTGLMLSSDLRPMLGPSSFGHDGAAGGLAFADRDARVGFAFLPNVMGPMPDDRANKIVSALQRALG